MKHALAGLVVVLLLLAGPAVTLGEEKDTVDIEVWVIRASTKNKEISPELKELAERLQKDFKYTGFKLERRTTGRAQLGRGFTTDLLEDYRATITPRQREAKNLRLQCEVARKGKSILNTTVTAPTGSFVPFGVGPLENTDFLITAVRAR